MTEKRFDFDLITMEFIDTESGNRRIPTNNLDGLNEISILLNELNDGKNKLSGMMFNLSEINHKLEKENEQLKEKNEELKSALSDIDWSYEQSMDNEIETVNENLLLLKDVKQLKKENEELKNLVEALKRVNEIENRSSHEFIKAYSETNGKLLNEIEQLKSSIDKICTEIKEKDTITTTEILVKLMNILDKVD